MNSPFLTLLELAECRECSLVVAEDGWKDQVMQTGHVPGQFDPPVRELRTITIKETVLREGVVNIL